jgi:hypothetical protein
MHQERGEYRKDIDPNVKAAESLASFIGLEVQWLRNKRMVDVKRVAASFTKTFNDDLTRADASGTACTSATRGRGDSGVFYPFSESRSRPGQHSGLALIGVLHRLQELRGRLIGWPQIQCSL